MAFCQIVDSLMQFPMLPLLRSVDVYPVLRKLPRFLSNFLL
jgi:hypothetical protein